MRPLSWWFPGHLGVVVGTAGLALLAHFLALPLSASPSEASPLLGGFVLAAGAIFAGLSVVGLLRWSRERAALRDELCHLARCGQFFFLPLGLCIVGLGLLTYFPDWAAIFPALWWLAAGLWLALALASSAGVAFRPKPPISWALVTPGWLLPGAALHALVLLQLALEPSAGRSFFTHASFLLAVVLILLPTFALAARWLLAPMDAPSFGPSQWINLGAMGITTLTAAQLAGNAPARIGVLLQIFVTLFWMLGLAWLPLLLLAGLWRHYLQGVPFTYVPENWALVFSPAVFGVATLQLPAVGAGEWTYGAACLAFSFSGTAWAANLVMGVGAWRSPQG